MEDRRDFITETGSFHILFLLVLAILVFFLFIFCLVDLVGKW